jgi:glycosyltransferase involved in cell wall biosynthesis
MSRFAVVTPVRNGAGLVAETIRSVVSQNGIADGRHQLDYVVMDGASTDGTADVARTVLEDRGRVISRSDGGMYDALANGWAEVEGTIYFYLNAGDLLQPGALDVVSDLIDGRGIDWICGLHVNYSQEGPIVGTVLPPGYRAGWIRQGVYGSLLPPIQQESTFWSERLMQRIDVAPARSLKLAGDAYLWNAMAEWAAPTVVQAALSGFRHHGAHLSDARSTYLRELRSFSEPVALTTRIGALLERPLWSAPPAVKLALNRRILRYSVERAAWL